MIDPAWEPVLAWLDSVSEIQILNNPPPHLSQIGSKETWNGLQTLSTNIDLAAAQNVKAQRLPADESLYTIKIKLWLLILHIKKTFRSPQRFTPDPSWNPHISQIRAHLSEAYHQRANFYFVSGNNPGALSDFDHALKFNPTECWNIYIGRAQVLEQMGRLEYARRDLFTARRLAPPKFKRVEDALIHIHQVKSRKLENPLEIVLLDMIASGQTEEVRRMLACGVDPNSPGAASGGKTALMLAAKTGSREIVELLLQAGANLHTRSQKGESALQVARWNGQKEAADMLLKAGSREDTSPWVVRCGAARAGFKKAAGRLLSAGARTIQPAIDALQPFEEIRKNILRLCRVPNVGRLQALGDINTLVRLLGPGYCERTRIEAAQALAKIGDARAVAGLVELYRSVDDGFFAPAQEALAAIAQRLNRSAFTLYLVQLYIHELYMEGPSSTQIPAWNSREARENYTEWHNALEKREAQYHAWNDAVLKRALAAHMLGQLADPQAVEPLISCLRHHHYASCDFLTRKAAAIALGEIKDQRAVEPLTAALQDDHHQVRAAAAAALAEFGLAPYGDVQAQFSRGPSSLLGKFFID